VTLARCGADMIARRQRQLGLRRPVVTAAVAATFALRDDDEVDGNQAEASTFQLNLDGIGPPAARDIRLG